MFHRGIDEFFYSAEINDLIQLPGDIRFFQAENRAIQENIFPAS
jgi:hypothetical protein